jgi:rhodanese-related sulfurtransferase
MKTLMNTISREQLEKKMERSEEFALVEVLRPGDYEDFHLPGAINVPLGQGFDERIQHALPDKRCPVVVYCLDEKCNASPTAARRMEELGYEQVYDYAAGKRDWQAAGLRVKHS